MATCSQFKHRYHSATQQNMTNSANSVPVFLDKTELTIEAPKDLDVLCGSKSKATSNHPGNVLLREKVDESLEDYKNARSKQERIAVNRNIIQYMRRKCGSRFLKQNEDGTWSIAGEQAVRDKVSHAIRHSYSKQQKALSAPKPASLEDIKRGEIDEDSEDVEVSKKMHHLYCRQQEILAQLMATTCLDDGDFPGEDSSDSDADDELGEFLDCIF